MSAKPPPRRNVILEDVDALESRIRRARRKGLDRAAAGLPADIPGARRLLPYLRPFLFWLCVAFVLSAFAGILSTGHIVVVQTLLAPITDGGTRLAPTALAPTLLAHGAGADGALGFELRVLPRLAHAWWEAQPGGRQLAWAALAMFLVTLVTQVNKYTQKLIMRTVALKTVQRIRGDLFRRLMTLSVRFFEANHSAKVISRITNDLNNYGSLMVDVMVNVLSDAFVALGAIYYLWITGGTVAVLGVTFGIAALLPVVHIAKRIRAKEKKVYEKMGDLNVTLLEAVTAQKVVKAFGGEPHEQERFEEANRRYTRDRMKSVTLRARTDPLSELVGGACLALVVWFGGHLVLDGSLAASELMAMFFALVKLGGSVRAIGAVNTKYQQGQASADRVAMVLFSEPEIVDAPDAVPLREFREKVEFRGVHYAYDPEHPVLRDVSFELPKGRSLAIVGPTGVGKSTVADLIPRFYDVDAGSVTIDGVDVREYTVESLRSHVAIVTQDTLLFQDTIAANIAYAMPEASTESIEEAARAAFAHDFIERLPKGYRTRVGERGVRLSGGERQRIAIARALLRDAPILILDEATSALDSRAEAVVQRALRNLQQGRTTISIAHRLSTVVDSDQILVLQEGRIAERGTHRELLAKGGLYAEMWRLQVGDRSVAG